MSFRTSAKVSHMWLQSPSARFVVSPSLKVLNGLVACLTRLNVFSKPEELRRGARAHLCTKI